MRGAENRAGLITQLGFDSLAEVAAGDAGRVPPGNNTGIATATSEVATTLKGEAYRLAPRVRRKTKKHESKTSGIQQATFDELFTILSREAAIPRSITIGESWADFEPSGQLQQLDFDSLVKEPSDDVREVSAGTPEEFGIDWGRPAVQRSDVRADGSEEDGLRIGLGESGTAIVSLRRRRVLLDEPEPERQPSRDFCITEAHGVGTGSLHEKANANIAAIRLVKTLEEANRDATSDEKATLVRYAGWGALAGVFEGDVRRRPEWNAVATELSQLLTSEEYESARATTPNAHFTSPLVIQAIWHGLEKLGVRHGVEVLEPAMGIGHFFGCMPETLQGGNRTGVELDSITARIAQKLYPDTTIFAQGFEDVPLPDNYFDAVVGNVPFGDYAVHDPATRHSLTRSIHDYFFAKSLEKTRPGGIMALITSRYTMDKLDATIRTHLAEKADLVAAIRLPNTAFKGNAGTEVTTDILFLKKRQEGEEPAGEQWTQTEPIEIEGQAIALNEYYLRHPDKMLGHLTLQGTMYADREPTLAGELTQENLRQAIDALPERVSLPRSYGRETQPAIPIADFEQLSGIKDGGYAEIAGKIVIRCGNRFEPTSLSALETMRVRGLMQIRDAVRSVFATQLADAPEERIIEARQHLNRVYDQFVNRHGCITSRENLRAFTGDPDHPLLLSLEHYDAEKMSATKTVIFERRTLERYKSVEHVETP